MSFFSSSGRTSKLCVSMATIVWSVVVLARDEALAPRIYVYKQMLGVMEEDWWAIIGIILSVIGLCAIVVPRRFHWSVEAAIYWVLMVFWVFVDSAIMLTDRKMVTPAGAAGITTVMILSVVAAVSNRRDTK